MRKFWCLLLWGLLLDNWVFSDSVFKLDLTIDVALGVGSIGLFSVSQFIPAQTTEQTALADINFVDQALIFPYNSVLSDIGTSTAYFALMLPLFSVFYEINFPDRFLTYGIMYTEAFMLTFGTKDLLKALVSRYRPYTYLGAVPVGEEDDISDSFPSGHTSLAFLGDSFLSTTFNKEYSDSKFRLPLTIGAYTLAGAIALTRVFSGNHFVSDIFAGAVIGTFWGWIVPALHYQKQGSEQVLNVSVLPNGVSFLIKM